MLRKALTTPSPLSRRGFLKAAAVSGAAAIVGPSRLLGQTRPPYPYIDGLCFLPEDLADIGRSGLSSFILDISSVAPVETEDGSIRYYRSFDASAQSLVAMRRRLAAGEIPGAFLATRGSQILDAWRRDETAVFFQFQGAQPLEGDIWRLDLLYELGLRVLQLTHHNANPFAGGALDREPTGLTEAGFELVARMNELGVLPDISHGSDATCLDVTRASTTPVVLSHGAARAVVRNARCAPDEVIRAVADGGGVMGIFMMSFWLTNDAVPRVDHLVAQLRHVADVGGIEAVAIANDYPI